MLARLQRAIVAGALLLAFAGSILLLFLGRPGWALAGTSLIASGYVVVLAIEFMLLAVVQNADVAPNPTFRQLMSAWWGEVRVAPVVFLWRQPFRSCLIPDSLPSRPSGRRGVLLVHGFVCNRGLWNPWMREMRTLGIPFLAINLEPVFGSIEDYVQQIGQAVSRVEAATGLAPVLVGHSMGGVAIRSWFARCDTDTRVHRVITVGSPHQGTWLARFGYTTNGREMRPSNPWLIGLATLETPEHYRRFTCFFGHCDNIVFPAASGTLPGALNLHIPATAHVQMLFKPEIFAEMRRWVQ